MSNYLKPQSPLYHKEKDTYFYPLTTADQVITSTGERLNSLFKKTIRESATLRAADWSETLPYTQTITLTESTDDYNVDVNIAYNDVDNMTLNKAAGCLSYIKKNHKDITFYCLKSKPTINIPIEIAGTCRNTIATVEEGTKLNFDIKRYDTEEELLADTPMENTIGIVTTTPISKWIFDSNEPENPVDGMLWIKVGTESQVEFNVIKDTDIPIYPISAKQYVGGAWVGKTAMTYQGGTWVTWYNGELYSPGDTWDAYTGGWTPLAHKYFNPNVAQAPSVSFGTTSMTASYSGNSGTSGYSGSLVTKNAINITNYNTLKFSIKSAYFSNNNGYMAAFVTSGTSKIVNDSEAICVFNNGDSGTFSLDISSLTGNYYIGFALCSYSSTSLSIEVTSVDLD